MVEILRLVRPYWGRILAAVVSSLGVSGSMAGLAWIVKDYIDDVLVNHNYESLALLPFLFFGLFVVKGLFTFAHSFLMRGTGAKIIREMRNRLFTHLVRMPLSFFGKENTGKLVSRILNDTMLLQNSIVDGARDIFVEGFTALALLGVAFYRRWDLTLLTVTLLPAAFAGVARITRRLRTVTRLGQGQVADLSGVVTESLGGIKVVKGFGLEDRQEKRFRQENQRFYRLSLKSVRLMEGTTMLLDIVAGFGLAAVVAYGGKLAVSGVMSPGDFVSYLTATLLVYEPMRKLAKVKARLEEATGAYERIREMMKLEEERSEGATLTEVAPGIVYEHVEFSYEGESSPAVRDINLSIAPGERIALVGESGAGKTTLVDLLARFFIPTGGRIVLGGRDLALISAGSLRNLIGIVSQEVFLFDDTVAANIGIARPEAGREDIEAAARAAHAEEFIRRMPEGFETLIGERGVRLSGGQRQRISIARAILHDPPILILDEATSSLDSASEREVQKALDHLVQGRTTLVIAHRLSTVVGADRIVVLERGRIVETGNHDELMARGGVYARLWRLQAAGKTSGDPEK